ncbi:alpha/beta fold hydrolase [Arthrobacter sp. CAN_C5]|uniref:alpha/beta fold hydrolase n=1 Tax=Arthrobacter sp. CAN_C5 TaxID=2760706 RepID=UPI001AE4CF23|nr:alpha/beta fold hydrolase [Arthrobacter sp. CAN_C5]MBP2215971.1 hypothetical protein [Arthrobacter sp. CAN_C5]
MDKILNKYPLAFELLHGEVSVSEIVLVHGMAQEQETADSLEESWLPALAGGIRVAGYADLADRIWRNRHSGDRIEVRMAAYGDLFLTPGVQGSGDDLDDLGSLEHAVAESVTAEWLQRAAEREDHPDHKTAVRELGFLNPTHETQGIKEEAARVMINAATRLSWFGGGGAMAVAERLKKPLRQVTAYLTDQALRDEIQSRVLAHVGPETKVIVGHSLGSVVAYEIVAQHLPTRLPLLVTLGSPLGLRSIIYDRLQPQPPGYPEGARRWVNIADRNDLVAAEPDLTGLFERNRPTDAILESRWTVDNGAEAHKGEYYLGKREVGRPIAEALSE